MGKRSTQPQDHDEGSDMDDVPVEFDYCDLSAGPSAAGPSDPDAPDDFDILKRMTLQTLDADGTLFNLSELAETVLAQKAGAGIGSCIRAEGDGSGPADTFVVAHAAVLNPAQFADVPAVSALSNYLRGRAAASPSAPLRDAVRQLLPATPPSTTGPPTPPAEGTPQVGIILTDRMINLPTELMGDLYHFLATEIEAAGAGAGAPAQQLYHQNQQQQQQQQAGPVSAAPSSRWDKRWYNFSHLILLSRAFTLRQSDLDGPGGDTAGADSNPKKRKKKRLGEGAAGAGADPDQLFFFHPEDEGMARFGAAAGRYEFASPHAPGAADSRRAFLADGAHTCGHMIVFEPARFRDAYLAAFDGHIRGLGQ